MDEYMIYEYTEFLMISLYLFFIFLSVQIFFIWVDVDKNELKKKISLNGSLLKTSIIAVFLIGVFFIVHELLDEMNGSYLLFELFELSGFLCVLLFVRKWYLALKSCSHKKKPASDFLHDACRSGVVEAGDLPSFLDFNRIMSLRGLTIICVISLILGVFVPVSTIYFIMIIGFLFVPPVLALVSTLLGGFLASKELV